MRIAILGANGFIGSYLSKELKDKYTIIDINRDNYKEYVGQKFDIFINVNGNSKKYWAEIHPLEDFESNVFSTYKTLFDFKFKKYIYISSLDVYHDNIYGKNKKIAEDILWEYHKFNQFGLVILRLGYVIGKNMYKGILFDILKDGKLFVTKDSQFQLITLTEIVKLVKSIISIEDFSYQNLNIAGTTSITPEEIAKLVHKNFLSYGTIQQNYNHSIDNIGLKTSEEYIKEYLNEE